MDRSHKSAGMLSLLASGITFGALPIFVTWLTQDGISGWFQLATRIGLSSALSLALLQIFAPSLVRAGQGRALLVLALNGLLTLLSFTTYMFSIALGTSPPKAALLVQAFPIYVTLLGTVFLQEGLTREKVAAIAIGVLGTALTMKAWEVGGLTRLQPGDLLAAASGFIYACLIVFGRVTGVKRTTHPLTWNAWSLVFALVWLGVLALIASVCSGASVLHSQIPAQISPRILVNILGLAVLGTIVPYGLLYLGLSKTEAGTASVLLLIEPLSVLAMSAIFLGQTVDSWQAMGAVLILGAGVLVARQRSGEQA